MEKQPSADKTACGCVVNTVYMLYNKIMELTAKDVIKILKSNGWTLDRINGSHHIFKKDGFMRSVSVPVHKNKDIDQFAKAILKEAHIDVVTHKEVEK